jgi:hypothetical protein
MSDLGDNGAQLHTSSLAIDSQDPRLGQEITVQQRAPRALQTVLDGAVYVIHLSTAVPTVPSSEVPARVVSELQAHIGVLRVNRRAVLLLVTTPLFQSGSTSPDVEVVARLRDFSRWQLANSREMEMTELVELLNGMGDNIGRLAIVKQYSAPNNAVVALEVRYQTHAESQMRVPLA